MYFAVSFVIALAIAMSIGFYVFKNNTFTPPVEIPSETVIVSDPHAGDVRSISDADLQQALIKGMNSLVASYQTNLGLKMSDYLKEYSGRGLINTEINSLNDSLIQKNGPCWGIPQGECRE